MRKLFAEIRRVQARASQLSRAHRVNLALYAFALVGLGLIAMEVRGSDVSPREVRSLPAPSTTAPPQQPVVQPGDRRAVPEASDVEGNGEEPSPASGTATPAPTRSNPERPAAPSTGSEGEGDSSAARPQPEMSGSPSLAPVPLASRDVPVVVPGGSGAVPGLSPVPQPPPVPALPPRSFGRPAPDVGVPSPADPVLAEPPAPRFSGPVLGPSLVTP